MSNVVYGVCVGSWEKLARNASSYGDRPVLGLHAQPSIAVAYNTIFNTYRHTPPNALVLVHDDLEITDPDFEEKILTAILEGADIVGVIGGSDISSQAWWDFPSVGHQRTDSHMIDFGTRTGDVDCVDGSVMAFSPWAVTHLRFDESFHDFHAYACDICQLCKQHKRRITVVNADTHHHTTVGWKSKDVHESWIKSEAHFKKKWFM